MAFPIQIDATQLTCAQFLIPGVTGWLETKPIQSVQLEAGTYGVQTPAGLDTRWGFEVKADGTVVYETALGVGKGGFLDGSGTSNLTIVGYALKFDATQVTTQNFYLIGITSWSVAIMHTFHLLPGHYQFVQGNGPVPEADFNIGLDGKVDFPATSDGILSGRGSSTLTITGYVLEFDARQVTTQNFYLIGITSWSVASIKHIFHLLPGHYQFVQGNGPVPEADFNIGLDGKVYYPATSDGILSGRGSSTLTITGYVLEFDATQVTTQNFYLIGITSWSVADSTHTFHLLPGHYQFVQGNGPVPEADFNIGLDGKVYYPATSKGILSGSGSSTLTITGYKIQLDATALAIHSFYLSGITGWLDARQVYSVYLLPAHYEFVQNNGVVAAAAFQITLGGTVDYEVVRDIGQGGFLAGRGSHALKFVGYALLVDASAFPNTALVLTPLEWRIDTTLPAPQSVALLPQAGLTLELRTVPPKLALFNLARNGTLTLDEPYAFVELSLVGSQQLIRLTQNTLRPKRSCRPPFDHAINALVAPGQVRIVKIEYNPPGNDLAGEYALLQNESTRPVHLDGWTLRDTAKHVYTFPPFTLAPGQTVKLWTKAGKDDHENLYRRKRKAMWNNAGDTGILCDARGSEVGRYVYSVKEGVE